MIIAVINNMTDIPDSCYECPLTEYENGNCSILKQSGQQFRPYNCPLFYIDDKNGMFIPTNDKLLLRPELRKE